MKPAAAVKTHVKRHRVSFKLPSADDRSEMSDVDPPGDPLPIVELKPFVSKVWRREKSFVQTVEKCASIHAKSDKSDTAGDGASGYRHRESDGFSDYAADEPPQTAQSSHSVGSVKRLLSYYVNAYEDFNSQKAYFKSFIGEPDNQKKTRERLHPLTDSKSKKQLEHSASIIPGFITRDDRTKTTLNEISDGEPSSKAYDCRPKTVRPEEFQKQQEIKISGQPLSNDHRLSYECTPTPVKGYNSFHSLGIRHGSPASLLTTARVLKERRMRRAKTPLYDHLDRSGTLPSLIINATSLVKRESITDETDSEDFNEYRDMYHPQSFHKVGGIENSLVVLSKHGRPTKVERQLTFELESNLSRFRKAKDYSPFEINPSEIAKYCPTPVLKMTRGEEHIRQALQSNSSKRSQRRKKEKMHFSTAGTSNITDHDFPAAFGKSSLNSEHIDSFNTGFHPYVQGADRQLQFSHANDEDYSDRGSPEDDLTVPYDTPRSQIASRFSLKHSEDMLRVHSEPIHEHMVKEKENDSTVSQPEVKNNIVRPIPSKTSKSSGHVNFTAPREQSTASRKTKVKNNVSDIRTPRIGLAQGKILKALRSTEESTIDPSGRTFLTSDNVLQATTVNG